MTPLGLYISLYHLVALGTIFSGLTLALLLAFAKKASQAANLFLSLALAVILLTTGGLTPIFLPALGPLLYLYVRRLTRPGQLFRRKDMLHFCPVLAGLWIPVWVVLISVIIYLYLCHRLIQRFYSRLRPVLMDRPRFAFRRLNKTLFLLGICCLLWLLNDNFCFAVSFVLIGMAVDAMLKPDTGAELAKPITDRVDAREKARRLKEAIAANRLYEDAELTLATLAVKLNIHPHDLSRIINTGLEKNFNDFINEFRVREIARKMKAPAYDQLTLVGIAYESGFNSQRTFNRVFKEMTGKTPVEYKNSMKKELPIDKLATSSQMLPVILRSESPPTWAYVKIKRNYMFKNYLKIAWRNIARNKAQAFINISGLSVGMAVAMLIGLWVWDELSYDKYFMNYESLVHVMQHRTFNGDVGTESAIPLALGPKLRSEYTGTGKDFKYVVMSTWNEGHIIAYKDKKLNSAGNYMQPEAPEMFALKMLKGSRAGLKDPSSVLLSASLAKAIFGDADPMGRVLKINNDFNVSVTGVFEDIPRNNSLTEMAFMLSWDMYVSNHPNVKNNLDDWENNSWQLFARLNPGVNADEVSAHIKDLKLTALKAENDRRGVGEKPSLFVFPANKWHLYAEFKNGVSVGGQIAFVRLFGIIGIFVLLLACINFMNLSTARSEKRAKEVGIRKTLGSMRQQLVSQFFSESLLVSVFAFLFSIILVQVALSTFNEIANKQIALQWSNPLFWIIGLAFSLLTGVIAGSYPAFYLSSFQPVKVLKGTFKAGRLASLPRKILVVLQFTVSATLIIGSIVVFRQVQFSKNRDVGYSRDGMIQAHLQTPNIHAHFTAVKADLVKSRAITDIAESWSPVTDIWSDDAGFSWEGMPPGLQPRMAVVGISPDFGKTVRWNVMQGRDFSKEFLSDSGALIVNETAVKFMGLKKAVGKTIRWGTRNYQIVGVVKDMVMSSPYDPVSPTVFRTIPGRGSLITIRLNPQMGTKEALSKVEAVFKQYDPSSLFDYNFTDTEYAKKFADEERIGKLAGIFTILAIFISCMGIFGMASFMAGQRIKEIGVRKVLGASIATLWGLMSGEFLALVGISLFIAIPLGYYFMSGWLGKYPYHAALSWWIFALTAIGAITITLLTVSYHSIKAAMANPVRSLRSE